MEMYQEKNMANAKIQIGDHQVGEGEPIYVIAEIGINHNGSVELAKRLIEEAARAGCDAVKFQKRTPEMALPREQWNIIRETPWGRMTYIDYRRRVEFKWPDYVEIDRHCAALGIDWFASCWDEESVDFIERFNPPCHKVASASVTDLDLLRKIGATGRPIILSTGMSTLAQIADAVEALDTDQLLIAHSTSSYPCPVDALNLRMIQTLKGLYVHCPIGYSGHETGLVPTWAAVALGATFVERHITLDRAMWGSDQAASVEITGLKRLVDAIRDIEIALGDGIKRIHESELASIRRLRGSAHVESLAV
jgi:N-acetylneuraminate synthase